jgi:histidinol-phosphate aminotransferase
MAELEKVRLPYNINALTQATAEFMLDHSHVLEEQCRRICGGREFLLAELRRMRGIKVWPSSANFILFRTLDRAAQDIYDALKQRGILIKNLHGSHPLLDNCLRVNVGTEQETQSFLEAVKIISLAG